MGSCLSEDKSNGGVRTGYTSGASPAFGNLIRELSTSASGSLGPRKIRCRHNYPLGNLDPSKEGIEITGRLKSAGEILGIKLLDHIIFNRTGYFSFLEKVGLSV